MGERPSRWFRANLWIHRWASVVATAPFLVLCITGIPLIFHDELDAALGIMGVQPGFLIVEADSALGLPLGGNPDIAESAFNPRLRHGEGLRRYSAGRPRLAASAAILTRNAPE